LKRERKGLYEMPWNTNLVVSSESAMLAMALRIGAAMVRPATAK
jgi:hypothetical protein